MIAWRCFHADSIQDICTREREGEVPSDPSSYFTHHQIGIFRRFESEFDQIGQVYEILLVEWCRLKLSDDDGHALMSQSGLDDTSWVNMFIRPSFESGTHQLPLCGHFPIEILDLDR